MSKIYVNGKFAFFQFTTYLTAHTLRCLLAFASPPSCFGFNFVVAGQLPPGRLGPVITACLVVFVRARCNVLEVSSYIYIQNTWLDNSRDVYRNVYGEIQRKMSLGVNNS